MNGPGWEQSSRGAQRNTGQESQGGRTEHPDPERTEQRLLRLYWAALGVVLVVAILTSSAPAASRWAAIILAGLHPPAYHLAARIRRDVNRCWLLALDTGVGLGVYLLTGATGTSHLLAYFVMGLAAGRSR